MIIDGHTHLCGQPHTQEPVIWKIVEGGSFTAPFTREEGKVDLLLRDMDERGVDKAVVMGFLDQISNEQLSELMSEHPERIIGFAGVADPKSEDSVTMLKEAVGELGLRGLKLHPDLHSFSPADPEIVPLIRCAAELDVPVLIHCYPGGMVRGYFNLNTPGHIDTLKRRVPEATIIVGHLGSTTSCSALTGAAFRLAWSRRGRSGSSRAWTLPGRRRPRYSGGTWEESWIFEGLHVYPLFLIPTLIFTEISI